MFQEAIISQTAVIHGRGSNNFKWVSGMTKEERVAVREGKLVLVPDNNPHPACTPFKQVYFRGGKYYHRNYTA